MIHKIETMPWNLQAIAESLYNYISLYDDRFVLDSENDQLVVNNKFKVKVVLNQYSRPAFQIICNDEDHTAYTGGSGTSGSWSVSSVGVELIISDNLFYFRMWMNASQYVGFCWLIDENGVDFASPSICPTIINIEGCNFYNTVTGLPTVYKISPFINFAIPENQLLYTDESVLLSSTNGDLTIIPNTLSCSTLTRNQVITMRGKNYLAVGINTLILIEE